MPPQLVTPQVATPPPTPTPSATPATWDDIITGYAKKYQIDPRVAKWIAQTESSINPAAVSSAGARGIMQLMPATAARHNVDPNDSADNIRGGLEEFRQLLDVNNNDVIMALRQYNASPQAPREVTDPYVQKFMREIGGGAQAAAQPAAQPTRRPGDVTVPPPFTGPAATAAATPGPPPSWPEVMQQQMWSAVGNFAGEATQSLNPVNIVKGAYGLLTTDPRTTGRALWDAHGRMFDAGSATVAQGQAANDTLLTLEGRIRQAAASIPLLGLRVGQVMDYARQGEFAKAAGAGVDVVGQVAQPKLFKGARARIFPRAFPPRLTPQEAAAVQLGQGAKIPVGAATASGSPFALKLQRAVEATPSGSPYAERAALARGERMPVLGENLARPVYPTAVMPEQAGAGLRQGVETFIGQRHGEANLHYDALRQIEASAPPQQVPVGMTNSWLPDGTLQQVPIMGSMQLPANLLRAKAILRPVADRFAQLIGSAQAEASPGLKAIRQILDGPDYMPASQLDANLSLIKDLGRGADLPQLRNVSQGLAAKAVEALEQAHADAIQQAGPQAQQALAAGRAATAAKYAAQEVLDQLRTEPVQTFRGATLAKDANINHLRDLARLAPGELPKVGRAVLEDLFDIASREGGWQRATGLEARWSNLGPQTKRLLFGPAAADLDRFFLLGKMLERSPNPSGTALTLTGVGSLWAAIRNPGTGLPALLASGQIAKLMNTPGGVRFLTEGLTIPAGTARATAWSAAALGRLGQLEGGAPPPPPLR